MNDYDPKTWNLNAFEGDDDILINRTNNPLERYNRTLNDLLPTHPTMAAFVEAIQGEGRRYVDLLDGIKFKRIKATHRENVSIPKIPQAYLDFEVEVKKKTVNERTSFMEPPRKRFVYKK